MTALVNTSLVHKYKHNHLLYCILLEHEAVFALLLIHYITLDINNAAGWLLRSVWLRQTLT